MWKVLLVMAAVILTAQEHPQGRTIVFGTGPHPWSSFSRDGTQIKPGASGDALGLMDRSGTSGFQNADFYLTFEDDRGHPGTYRALDPVVITRRTARMGTGAGVFQNDPAGVRFEAGPASLFAPGNVWHDFTMDFWLYLPSLSDGATVILWSGAYRNGSSIVPQEFRVAVRGRVLELSMNQFFRFPAQGAPASVVLAGETSLLPGRWYHHHFQYHSDRGLLEYTLDGKPEAALYVTSTGRESGQVYLPYIGELSKPHFVLGEGLTALLDDVRISRSVTESVQVSTYDASRGSPRGTAVSPVVDNGSYGYFLEDVSLRARTPGPTRVRAEIRAADRLDASGGVASAWLPWPRPAEEAPLRGRFAQVRLRLEGDGEGMMTPLVETLTLRWVKVPEPSPPQFVALRQSAGWELSWRPSSDFDVSQYRVYWSLAPGRFDPTKYMTVTQGFEAAASWDRGERPRVRLMLSPDLLRERGDPDAALAASGGRVIYFSIATVKTVGSAETGRVDILSGYSETVSGRWQP